jgi:indolepyruvate ferredoxin oxidoreductase beta subunit
LEHYREAIRESGIGVEPSLAAFEAGRQSAVAAAGATAATAGEAGGGRSMEFKLDVLPESLRRRVAEKFPDALHSLLGRGCARLIDFQDEAYAALFLDRIAGILTVEAATVPESAPRLTEATARSLALWMSFEDVFRVAQAKTRRGRAEEVRREVRAAPAEIVRINEFVKPRVEEICASLPACWGARMLASPRAGRFLARFTAGRQIRTSTVTGFLTLRALAGLKRFRRGTLRYRIENQRLEAWLDQVGTVAPRDHALAVELAECQNLVKGYGDTHTRGWRSFERISAAIPDLMRNAGAAERVRALREAALADDSGGQLERLLSGV